MTTTQELSPSDVEQIWYSARVLDNDPQETVAAVVVIRHRSLGYIQSGEYGSMAGAKRGIKRHAAKEYATAAYIVSRGRGESYDIQAA